MQRFFVKASVGAFETSGYVSVLGNGGAEAAMNCFIAFMLREWSDARLFDGRINWARAEAANGLGEVLAQHVLEA